MDGVLRCLLCNHEFVPTQYEQLYCSSGCEGIALRRVMMGIPINNEEITYETRYKAAYTRT